MDSLGRAGPEPARRGRKARPSTTTLRQGYTLISQTLGTGSRPSHRGHDKYQSAATDRGGMTAFRDILCHQWPRQGSWAVQRRRRLVVPAAEARIAIVRRAPPEHLCLSRAGRCIRVALRELLFVGPNMEGGRVGDRGNCPGHHLDILVSDGSSLMSNHAEQGGAAGRPRN